jgi:4-amino-4-deoxy-L-arabinose transferase-like glycosyltransferase
MPHSRSSTWVILALLGVIALAASLRFFQIDRLPPGLSYDEAWNDRQALRVVQGRGYPVYFVDEWGDVEEPLHIYLIAALFALTGPQAIGGRLVSALLGALTVPLLFFTAREMLRAAPRPRRLFLAGREEEAIALLAAFILATLYWHVHYTRLGMEPPTVPAMATLTFWLLWRAFNRGGWLDYALAGGALGLSLYTHISARFLPLVVVLFAIWRWGHDRALIRRELPRWALLVVCAAIIFAPLGLFFVENPDLFVYRAKQASAVASGGRLSQTLDNAIKVVGGLFWRGDTNLRLNLPGRPGLDAVQSLLFVAGSIYALRRERRRALAFPLIWAGVMILPSVFSDAAPHFGRMLGATPAIALLIALGCAQLLELGSEIRSPFKRNILKSEIGRVARLGLAVAIVAPVYSAVRMGRDYFATWARDPGLYTAFDVGLRESAEYLARLSLHVPRRCLSPQDVQRSPLRSVSEPT